MGRHGALESFMVPRQDEVMVNQSLDYIFIPASSYNPLNAVFFLQKKQRSENI